MARYLKIAGAQMGPNQDGTPREAIVERMLALLDEAARDDVELIVYPEMALTTYFPKRIRQDFDQFFETEVPPKALEPLLRRAAEARVGVHVGFCEKADGKYFNTALLTDRDGRLCGTFRKIHLPGTKAPTASLRCTSLTTSLTATPATGSSTPPAPASASRSARIAGTRRAIARSPSRAPRSSSSATTPRSRHWRST